MKNGIRTRWTFLLLCLWGTVGAQFYGYECLTEQRNDFVGSYTLLTQASEGSLWLGTSEGVWTYDGQLTTRQDLSAIIGTTEVSTIAESREGRMWLGFYSGQIVYEDALGAWQAWDIEEGLPQARITAIEEDEFGDRWLGTYGEGVYCYRDGRLYQFGEDDGLPSSDVYDLKLAADGLVWVATDAGICLLGWRDGSKWLRTFSTADGLPDNIVTALCADAKGGCWIGTYEGGVAHCSYADDQFSVIQPETWPGGIVTSLTKVDERQLWVGTAEEGLHIYELREKNMALVTTPLATPPRRIQSLLFDQEGLLWILSHDQGLCQLQPRLLVLENLPIVPQALAIDQNNTLWVGSQEGLYYRAAQSNELRPFPLQIPLNIISLYVDERNRLWLGTFGEGVYILDKNTQELQAFGPAEGLHNGSILSITGDQNGIWLATLGGVYYTGGGAKQPQFVQPASTQAIGTDFLYTNFIDGQGTVWFGTDGYGLSALAKDGTLSTYRTAADSTAISSVYAIVEDGLGRIWISTDDQQLFYFENGALQPVNLPLSYGRNEIISLSTDVEGNILIAHQEGIAVCDVETFTTVDYYLGQNAGFKPVLNAVVTDQSGRVWLGGVDQLVTYVPFANTYRQQPRLHLDQVSVYLAPLNFRENSVLKASENNLIFRYQGIWLSAPEEVRYQYQLKGFDQNWIVTRDQQAVYSNLPPGAYEFVVTAAHNDRFHPEQVRATYAFEIRPPVYLQGWFIGLAVFLIALLGRFLLLRRENRLQTEALLLKDKVESQYETLKSQINPHFLFNSFNTLVTLIEEDQRAAVTYVEKLADFYRSILQYREQDAVALEVEMQVVKDYHFLLMQRYQENLQLDISELPPHAKVPPLSVQMLLENAVKHNVISKRHPLQIRIFTRADYLIVENAIQPKFISQPSTGFGLQNIRNRYGLLTQRPVLVEGDDKVFSIGLPLIEN